MIRPLGGVDQEHLARLEPTLEPDLLGRDRQHAGLAGQHDQVVVGDHVPAGPQAVAVEHRADQGAVGEDQAGRAVPGLGQAAVVLVEGPPRRVEVAVALVGLGHQHHARVRQAPARVDEQLEHLVEDRRVAQPLELRAGGPWPGRRRARAPHPRLAGLQPVDVALERVDLAVVGEQVERLGEAPLRERVRAVPAVDQGQGRFHRRDRPRSGKYGLELVGLEHPLVDDRAGAATGDREPERRRWPMLSELAQRSARRRMT